MTTSYRFSVTSRADKATSETSETNKTNKTDKVTRGMLTTFVLFGSLFLTTGCPGSSTTKKTEPKETTKPEPAKPGGTGSNAPGPASQLVFMTQPGGGTADSAWAQQPKVAVQDASGKTVTASLADVTLALVSSGPESGSGTLEGGNSVKAKEGVASFLDLSIRKVGRYTLKASSPNLADATSKGFEITHGAATQLVFTKQPEEAVVKKAFSSQPVVAIRDAHENSVTSGADSEAVLTIELFNPNPPGARLGGSTSSKAALGVVSWADLSIDTAGDYTLTVKKPDLTAKGGAGSLSVNSKSFSIIKLLTVTSLTARGGDGNVVLKWKAATGAVTYNILRGDGANALTTVLGPSSTNEYKDTNLENGRSYFYAVQAVDSEGSKGDNSQVVQVKPLSTAVIEKIEVNDEGGGGALVVSWRASTGASSYTVKYSPDSGGAKEGAEGCKVTEQKCFVRGLTAERTYYLAVEATNEYSGQVVSGESSGIPRAVPTLKLLGKETRKNRNGECTDDTVVDSELSKYGTCMSVAATVGPGSSQQGITYKLYYKASSDSSWSEVPDDASNRLSREGLGNVAGLDGATTGDGGQTFSGHKTYPFKGKAVFPNGSLSSKEHSITATPLFRITSALPGDGKIQLGWAPAEGAKRYVLTCKNLTNPSGACSMNQTVGTGNQASTKAMAEGLTNLNQYSLGVAAIISEGTEDGQTVAYVTKEATSLSRYPAKPVFLSGAKVGLERKKEDAPINRALKEQSLLKEENIILESSIPPGSFWSSFKPSELGSICGGTKEGCKATVGVAVSESVITVKSATISGGAFPIPAPVPGDDPWDTYRKGLFLYGVPTVAYSGPTGKGGKGLLFDLPLHNWALAGTAIFAITMTYGLETVTSTANFELTYK